MPGPGDRNFRLLDDMGIATVPITNNSGGDLKAGDAITISAGTIAEVADVCTTGIIGILADDIDDADTGAMYVDGIFEVDAAASQDFAMGEAVYAASASTVDTGTAGDRRIGYVVGEDPADGAATVKFRLLSVQQHELAVHA
jgi:predicted RecA/RadA family phage recombinase